LYNVALVLSQIYWMYANTLASLAVVFASLRKPISSMKAHYHLLRHGCFCATTSDAKHRQMLFFCNILRGAQREGENAAETRFPQ
jgi:hypothetical protein